MKQGTLYIGQIVTWGARLRGVGASFVRNLIKGRSKLSASQAILHLLETRLRGGLGKGF